MTSVTREQYTTVLRQLPPLMKVVLSKEALIDGITTIEQKFHLNGEQLAKLMAIERSVIAKVTAPAAVVGEIESALAKPTSEAKEIARDWLGLIALPMEWYIGAVQPLVQELGGDVAAYLSEAKKNFPEVYDPNFQVDQTKQAETELKASTEADNDANPIFHEFEVRLSSFRGRAEILLRLTGLGTRIEQGVQAGAITQADGEELIRQLDAVSSFINTQELNPFEIQAVKRKIKRVLERLQEVAA